jgi:hypothetical protein
MVEVWDVNPEPMQPTWSTINTYTIRGMSTIWHITTQYDVARHVAILLCDTWKQFFVWTSVQIFQIDMTCGTTNRWHVALPHDMWFNRRMKCTIRHRTSWIFLCGMGFENPRCSGITKWLIILIPRIMWLLDNFSWDYDPQRSMAEILHQ